MGNERAEANDKQEPVRDAQSGARGGNSSGVGARAMVTSGIRDPQAYAQLIASHPQARAEIIAVLHSTLGNGFVGAVLELADKNARPSERREDASASALSSPNNVGEQIQAKTTEASKTGELSLQSEIQQGQRAIEFLGTARQMLLPGYRRAVDELLPGPTIELATHIVSIVKGVQRVHETLAEVTKRGVGGAMVSLPNGPIDENPDAAAGRFAEVAGLSAAVGIELDALTHELAIKLGPQIFRDHNVTGRTVAPGLGKDPAGYLTYEAGTTVELLATIKEVQSLTGADGKQCPILTDAQREGAVALIEPWKGRPVNLAFLRAVLTEIGVWDEVAATKGGSGKTLAATANKSEAQGLITGALEDVGEFDGDEAAKLLTESPGERLVEDMRGDGDAGAMTVFEKVAGAAPSARGPLIRQLNAMGRLDSLCTRLPRKAVEDLAGVVAPFDPGAAQLLQPFIEGQGGGESLHQMYMDKVDENLEEDTAIDNLNAYGWFLLDSVHNAFTAGFMHEFSAAYDAHEAGLISRNEFKSKATKSLGKAAAVLAVSALTGGVVGEYVSGAAAPFVGEGVASVIGGGVGGFSAGVSGHFTGDVYDQLLNGKQGFDSAGDYLKSGAIGGVMGVTTAMISTLSIQSTGLLRSSARRTADVYAKRYPSMTSAFERIRAAGANRGVQIKLKVGELVELINRGMGGPGGPGALQLAGGMDFRMLPPETELIVRMSADDMFNRPMQMSGPDDAKGAKPDEQNPSTSGSTSDAPAIKIEGVDVEARPGSTAESATTSSDPAASTSAVDSTPAVEAVATPTASPQATRLLAKGLPQETIAEVVTKLGQPGLEALDHLVSEGAPPKAAADALEAARKGGVANEAIDLINSGKLRNIDSIRKLLKNIEQEATRGEHNYANELREAKAIADEGKEVSVGGTKHDPKKPESGQADVVKYGDDFEAVQMKTVTAEDVRAVSDRADSAVNQLKGKGGEVPPNGAKKVALILVENAKNPMYSANRADMIAFLKSRMQNLVPGDIIEIRVRNGTGEMRIQSGEIVP